MMIGTVIEKVHITVGHSEFGRVTFDLDVRMQGANSRDDGFIAKSRTQEISKRVHHNK